MVTCQYCGGSHAWFQCVKKPDGWKPSRKEVVPRTPDDAGAIKAAPRKSIEAGSPRAGAPDIEPVMRAGLPPAEPGEIERALAYYRKHRERQRRARERRRKRE